MVIISNEQRDQAVRYLKSFTKLVAKDNSLKVVNLRRLATKLAGQLERKEKQ